uniref:Uncharacterized protein n=1 Tax=Cucumis melo TaxID=3656 RepID=A0A9I9E3I5_CUCME
MPSLCPTFMGYPAISRLAWRKLARGTFHFLLIRYFKRIG